MGTRQQFKLTAVSVKRAKDAGRVSDGGGLYLQINKRGNRSWIFKYVYGHHSREMGLGSLHSVSLELARKLASQQRELLAQELDPISERNKRRQALKLEAENDINFEQLALECIERKKFAWRNAKHAQQWQNTLKQHAFPIIGKLSINDIQTAHILRILEPIWTAKHPTATRLRERIETILDAAKSRGFYKNDNPARWRGHLENLLAKPSEVRRIRAPVHHAALPYQQVSSFVASLRSQEGFAARALELTILSACRTSEVLGARWQEIDLNAKVWGIPGSRIKAGRDHRVPLSQPALAILHQQKGVGTDYVFPGLRKGKPLSNMAMLKVLERMGREDITVHGFRSSFRDWAAEQTNFSREVAEMALAHTIENKVEAAYRRGDLFGKRAKLMEAWAAYCERPLQHEKILAFA